MHVINLSFVPGRLDVHVNVCTYFTILLIGKWKEVENGTETPRGGRGQGGTKN